MSTRIQRDVVHQLRRQKVQSRMIPWLSLILTPRAEKKENHFAKKENQLAIQQKQLAIEEKQSAIQQNQLEIKDVSLQSGKSA